MKNQGEGMGLKYTILSVLVLIFLRKVPASVTESAFQGLIDYQ
jgi:hypothetical protein